MLLVESPLRFGVNRMKSLQKQQMWLIVSCLACVVVALLITVPVEGTEFSGGWLTGPLLSMADTAALLFVLALIVTFWAPRIAAAVGLASCLLCLPLYLYFIAPVPFSQVFGFAHESKVQFSGGLHWNTWAIGGVLTLAVNTYVCLRGFAVASGPRI
jgi:hypothetical protein